MTTKAPSILHARDILHHVVRLANLIEMAASSLDDPEQYDAISMGTNAIIGEIEKADEILKSHQHQAAPTNPQTTPVKCGG